MAKEAKLTAIIDPAPVTEEVYAAAEIAANAPRLFGYSKDLAAAALDFNHITRCTLAKAKQTIKDFAERKVN